MTTLHAVLGGALLALLVGAPLLVRLLNWLDDREAARFAADEALTEFLRPIRPEGSASAGHGRAPSSPRSTRPPPARRPARCPDCRAVCPCPGACGDAIRTLATKTTNA